MKKLLVSDFDNTLFFPPGYFKEEDINAVKDFQSKGNLFAINTGRGYRQMNQSYPEGYVPPIRFDMTIADSGTTLLDHNDQLVEGHPIPFEVIKAIHEALPDVYKGFTVEGEYTTFGDNVPDFIKDRIVPIESLDEIKDRPVYSISLRTDNEKEAKETLKRLDALNFPVEGHINRNYIDVCTTGFSKAKGLRRAGELLDVEPESIYAIGDSWNDLPALLAASKAYLIEGDDSELNQKAIENDIMLVDSVAQAIALIEQGDAKERS